jgi:ABC-type uncharacterized transport system substrate-binding protein
MPRVGVLANGTAEKSPPIDAFRQGLRDLGYVDGQNVALEIRGAEGHFERLPEMAVELVRWKPDVLVTAGPYGLQAARRATTAIPIVMIICDPAETVVERIARPSGHITGVTCMSSDLTAKRLQLLKEAVPSIRRVAVLYNPFDPQQATTTIPIVMGVSADPVRLGFVKSLAQPGGNTTGVATMQFDLAAKRLELFKEAIPTLRYVAVLLNPANPGEDLRQMEVAGRKLGVRLRSFELVGEPAALQTVFAAILRERPDGLIVVADSLAVKHSTRIGEFAARNRLPAMAAFRNIVADGGLISYGGDYEEGWRVAARYVDKILKGAKPADLPVEQPTKFELVINLKTAKALGLTIPPSLLARADQVIE